MKLPAVANLIGTQSQELTMARQSQPTALKAAVLAPPLAVAGCDSAERPMAPDAAEPLPAASVPAPPDLLTAGTGQRILFSSARSGGTDIYRMAPDGTGLVRVTSLSGPEVEPVWSWDNKRIAMVRDRVDASNQTQKDIYIMNAEGTGKKWARPAASSFWITDPAWSPDGKRLAVTVWLNGARGVPGTPYLALMDAATGQASFIYSGLSATPGAQASFDPTG